MYSILFTFQKEFPEFLGKWKAPEVFNPLTVDMIPYLKEKFLPSTDMYTNSKQTI